MDALTVTELGSLPSDWRVQRFDSLFAVQQGKQVSKKNRVGENQRPFLRTKNVFWGHLDLAGLDEMHFTDAEEKRLALQPGDLLVCEGGDIGRTAIWKGELARCYYQNHLHRARLRDDAADSLFALYWLWYAFEIGSVYFGRGNVTTIPNLSQSNLCELPLPVPPLHEQQKIAGVLGVVQQAIEQQERLLQLTAELKKTLLHQLFTQGLRGEPLKQTGIGPVPESWEVVELGKISHKPEYGFTESAKPSGNAQFLRITDIQEDGVRWESVPFCECPEELIERYLLADNDVLFARIGATTGKNFLVKKPPVAVFASYLIRVRLRGEVSADFVSQFCDTRAYWRQIDTNKGNNLKGGINSSTLKRLLVPVPVDRTEQCAIADIFRQIDMKAAHTRRKRTALADLFRTLLHQLMTAQIRVHDLDLSFLIASSA